LWYWIAWHFFIKRFWQLVWVTRFSNLLFLFYWRACSHPFFVFFKAFVGTLLVYLRFTYTYLTSILWWWNLLFFDYRFNLHGFFVSDINTYIINARAVFFYLAFLALAENFLRLLIILYELTNFLDSITSVISRFKVTNYYCEITSFIFIHVIAE